MYETEHLMASFKLNNTEKSIYHDNRILINRHVTMTCIVSIPQAPQAVLLKCNLLY